MLDTNTKKVRRGAYQRIVAGDLDGLYEVDPETGCHLWLGRLDDFGYGVLDVPVRPGRNRQRKAHRVVWEETFGAVHEQHELLHLCESRRCINRDHMAAGTHSANMKDAAMKRAGVGRHAAERAA